MKIINGTRTSEFSYDGLGRRVRIIETENDVEQLNHVFIWDGSQIAQKRDSAGSTVQRNYFADGFSAHSASSAVHYFYTKDHLGSIREVVASDGVTVESVYDYSPWGEVTKIAGAGVKSDFLYTGHFFHQPSDLHLALYRAYDPELGMWLSRDPLESVTGELAELLPEGPNLYAYVGNDPTNWVDPDGLFLETVWDIGVVLYDLIKGDWGAAAVDGACALTPFLPGGAGAASKAAAKKGLGGNPFKGKNPNQMDKMFKEKGFEPRGPNPKDGRGGYVNPKTGRSYHIDPGT